MLKNERSPLVGLKNTRRRERVASATNLRRIASKEEYTPLRCGPVLTLHQEAYTKTKAIFSNLSPESKHITSSA